MPHSFWKGRLDALIQLQFHKVVGVFKSLRYPGFRHDAHSLSLHSLMKPVFVGFLRGSRNCCLPRFWSRLKPKPG